MSVARADAVETPDDDLTRDRSASGALPIDSATLRPGQRFDARYTIIRLLGSGGMGDVYQAWDESLGIAVALKTIKADPAAPPGTAHDLEERFKRELRLARQVSHPNVVRIHDLGELGAVKYLTMAYVQGENLATVLGTKGKLPVPRALAIGRQIAAGLAAAHEAGVVHRDLKPANVLIDQDQRALLTDFGIARAVDGGTVHTLAGAVVGTLAYMAPEQARGDVADQRSDVYGFGLILYELLAGGRPRMGGQSDLADLMARVTQGPIPLRQAAPGTPDPLVQLVDRCLERDPDRRFQDARDLLAALNQLHPDGTLAPLAARRSRWRLAAAVLAVVGTIIAGTWWLAVRNSVPPLITAHAPVSVLIADFENRAGDSVFDGSLEQALGIAVEGASFITSFSRKTAADRARELRPGSRLDVAAAQLVAVSEGIGVILAGSIRHDRAGYLLDVRALDPAGGGAIATVSEAAADKGAVLAAVGRLAQQVRAVLGDATPSAALQAETYSTSSLEAVHEYSIAQSLSVDGRNEEAIGHYRAAVDRDPRFGRAYAGWAASTYDLGRRTEAEELWKKALSLMDRMTDREKYRTLGAYFMNVARNYDKAIENYRQLVAQYPADLAGRNNLALAYFYTLDFPRALEEGRRAIDIYPKSPKFRTNYALYAMYAGDFATAVESAEQVLRTDPGYDIAYLPLAMAAAARGDVAGARAVYDRARTAGAIGVSLANMGDADLAIYEGRLADAASILASAIPLDEKNRNSFGAASKSLALAETLIALDRPAAAVSAAERGLALETNEFVAVPAARVFAAANHDDRAEELAVALQHREQPLPRAYAHVISGELALRRGHTSQAIAAFSAGIKVADIWLARFGRGVAFVEAERYAEALPDLELCLKRRGEATALFLDDVPTWRYMALLPYWHGRAQQGLGMTEAARQSFEQFLRLKSSSTPTPLLLDARARATALKGTPGG